MWRAATNSLKYHVGIIDVLAVRALTTRERRGINKLLFNEQAEREIICARTLPQMLLSLGSWKISLFIGNVPRPAPTVAWRPFPHWFALKFYPFAAANMLDMR